MVSGVRRAPRALAAGGGGPRLDRGPAGTPLRPTRLPASVGPALDLSDVRGQLLARRALEIAAAGGHNLLLVGPPGAGKTMLARRLPGILPPLTPEEAVETTAIHSAAGLPFETLLTTRPFRSPHHTASDAALVGGGPVPRPGEVSLAHNGVLFLDELPEFRRHVLEALRQPLEEGTVTVVPRARVLPSARALPARGGDEPVCVRAPAVRVRSARGPPVSPAPLGPVAGSHRPAGRGPRHDVRRDERPARASARAWSRSACEPPERGRWIACASTGARTERRARLPGAPRRGLPGCGAGRASCASPSSSFR